MSSIHPIHLPVETASGRALGRITDIEIDSATQGVTLYEVQSSRLPGLRQSIIIRPAQVISLDDQKMIVDDAVARGQEPLPAATA